MNHFIIDTGNSGFWFSLVFPFTILLVTGLFFITGLKQHRSFLTMLLITSSGMLFFLIGIHLFPLSPEEIKMVLISGSPSKQGEKSVLGGLLVIAGLLLAIFWLKEKLSLIDNLAVPFLAGIGLQNIGCLAAGCCYGNPSAMPWSIQYGLHSPAMTHELQNGLVGAAETASLPLHPVQFYLLLGCFLIAWITWRFKGRWHAPVSSFVFAWILYSALRFFIEFLRDPATNHGLGYPLAGLKVLQWVLLGTVLLLGFILYARELTYKKRILSAPEEPGNVRTISLLIFLVLLSWSVRGLIGSIGKMLVDASLLIGILLTGWKLFKTFTLPQYRLATGFAVLFTCVFMSQKYIPLKEDEKITYIEIGGGLQFGHFKDEIQTNIGQGQDCDGNYYTRHRYNQAKYNHVIGGLTLSKTENLDLYKRFRYGLNISFGTENVKGIDTNFQRSLPIIDALPFVSFDNHFIGISAGLHLGSFHYDRIHTSGDAPNIGDVTHEVKQLFIYPSLKLRAGPYDLLYFEGFLADHFPSASPLMMTGFSLGSGLGKTDGRNISIGASFTNAAMIFLKASYPLNDNYFLDAFYGNDSNAFFSQNADNTLFSFGLHHRFNYKTVADSRGVIH